MIIYMLLHLRNVQADRQTTLGSQIDTELRQAMSGQVLQQLALGELDVGFYLATAEE